MSEVRFEETDHGPSLTNSHVTVHVHLTRGTFDVIDVASGESVLTGASAGVSLAGGPHLTTRGEQLELTGTKDVSDAHGRGTSIILLRETPPDEPELTLTLTLYEVARFITARLDVQNSTPHPFSIQALRPVEDATVRLHAGGANLRFYKHGWQSWSPTLVLDCSGDDLPMSPPVIGPGTQPPAPAGRFVSDTMTAIVNPETDAGIVVGFITASDQFGHVWFDRDDSTLTAIAHADGVRLGRRDIVASESLYIEPTTDPACAMIRYGDALAREMEAIPSGPVTSGWCSWYYYWQGVTEAEVLANLGRIDEERHRLPFEYIQIDDGYQAEIGDWLTTNDKFPNGMKWLADQIHERGFKAGIWVAPFLAGARSRLFQNHPDWFVKFSTGAPAIATLNWGQLCYALDLTNPDVLAWLRELFSTICDDWGYDYVKIDFIFAGAVDGVRHDPNLTRAQAYRRGLATIRDAVGERFILACGNPQAPSVGLVNGARIGPDVAPYWHPFERAAPRNPASDPAAINSIRNTLTRFWMHGRLWANDPDCLLARDTDTALSGDEIRSLATAIAMSGGMVLDSDNLVKLKPERIDLISAILPVYGEPAVPLDLFQTIDVPSILELNCDSHRILSVFNWSDEAATVHVPFPDGAWHAFEFWQQRYLGVISGPTSIDLPPHGCALLRLSADAGHPQVVGSTLHILQGALEIESEDWRDETLHVALRPVARKDGTIYIAHGGTAHAVPIEDLRSARTLDWPA
jgi:alpha-galactosidase